LLINTIVNQHHSNHHHHHPNLCHLSKERGLATTGGILGKGLQLHFGLQQSDLISFIVGMFAYCHHRNNRILYYLLCECLRIIIIATIGLFAYRHHHDNRILYYLLFECLRIIIIATIGSHEFRRHHLYQHYK